MKKKLTYKLLVFSLNFVFTNLFEIYFIFLFNLRFFICLNIFNLLCENRHQMTFFCYYESWNFTLFLFYLMSNYLF